MAIRNVGATAPREKPCAATAPRAESIDEECARVVEQTFPFQDGQNAMRGPQLTKDGGCSHGVGRSNDRAKDDCRRPWHRRHEPAGDAGNSDGGGSDRKQPQDPSPEPIVYKISKGSVVGRVEQYRRDKKRQRQIGSEVKMADPEQVPEEHPRAPGIPGRVCQPAGPQPPG